MPGTPLVPADVAAADELITGLRSERATARPAGRAGCARRPCCARRRNPLVLNHQGQGDRCGVPGEQQALTCYAVTFARNAARLATFRSICSSRVSFSWILKLDAVTFLPRVYSEQARSVQR